MGNNSNKIIFCQVGSHCKTINRRQKENTVDCKSPCSPEFWGQAGSQSKIVSQIEASRTPQDQNNLILGQSNEANLKYFLWSTGKQTKEKVLLLTSENSTVLLFFGNMSQFVPYTKNELNLERK